MSARSPDVLLNVPNAASADTGATTENILSHLADTCKISGHCGDVSYKYNKPQGIGHLIFSLPVADTLTFGVRELVRRETLLTRELELRELEVFRRELRNV